MADKYYHQRLIPLAATETAIYTVPAANGAILKSLRVTNADASASDITVKQYDTAAGTAVFLYKEQSLAADATIDVFAGVPCILETGNVLKVLSSQANVSFYLSYLEVDRN
jgi:hypothetical protein|tara:strand:- start:199 stop:531 length:333 start_codon:yes stop_codon:yes gene_type:complete